MKIGLILSNDWELFGNGSGDYFEIQHRPLQQLLDGVEAHGAKLTVMAEIGQQWAHQRLGEQESWAHEVACAWEASLQDTIRRGSDVQLHLHPQWLQASYERQQWQVDARRLSISSLSETEMATVLRQGKTDLETLLRPISPQYDCLAFRSGWYCMQPSQTVTRTLLNTGFSCDTSVVPGAVKSGLYDYRGAHSTYLPWFARAEDVRYASEVPSGLLEIPIHAVDTLEWPLLNRVNWLGLSNFLSFGVMIDQADAVWARRRKHLERQRRLAGGKSILEATHPLSLIEKLKRYWSHLFLVKRAVRLDYDNLLPAVFVSYLKRIITTHQRRCTGQDDSVILPIMASGHVKRMLSCDNIKRTLEMVNRQFKNNIVYWTLSDAVTHCLAAVDKVSQPGPQPRAASS